MEYNEIFIQWLIISEQYKIFLDILEKEIHFPIFKSNYLQRNGFFNFFCVHFSILLVLKWDIIILLFDNS